MDARRGCVVYHESMTQTNPAEIARLKAEALTAQAQALAAQAQAAAAKAAAAQAELDAALANDATSMEPSPNALSDYARQVDEGYRAEGSAITVGCLMEGTDPIPNVKISLPLAMLNRHGIIAGATGTGKTRTLQLLAELLSQQGVAVFATDIKGDLTGMLEPGQDSPKLHERVQAQGQEWSAKQYPVELYTLGGLGSGIPIRTSVTDFGPILMAKVLGLNETQESALSLIFHWADHNKLALIDLADLRSVISYLTSDGAKDELREIGGIAPSTAGVILRELAELQAQGGDDFFGEPGFDVIDLLSPARGGYGIVNLLELPDIHSRPALFSTFVMWLAAELFQVLPEVGDRDKPKLVFFFDEAHLLFNNATPEFLNQVVQTVRLIRSKGVGMFFVTQSPSDIPAEVLAQLGAKIQHAVRAHTPNDAKDLKNTVKTFPTSPLDLTSVLPALGTGEAIVTILDAKGRPTPVAPTRIFAPASVMGSASPEAIERSVSTSELATKYAHRIDPESAAELLDARIRAENARREAEEQERKAVAEKEKEQQRLARELQKEIEAERKAAEKARAQAARQAEREAERARKRRESTIDAIIKTAGRTVTSSIVRSIFGTRRR